VIGPSEGRILRSISGVVQDKGQWKIRESFELYKSYDEPDLANVLKLTN
jgi:hypothetical protein